jgi:hypothetical protein
MTQAVLPIVLAAQDRECPRKPHPPWLPGAFSLSTESRRKWTCSESLAAAAEPITRRGAKGHAGNKRRSPEKVPSGLSLRNCLRLPSRDSETNVIPVVNRRACRPALVVALVVRTVSARAEGPPGASSEPHTDLANRETYDLCRAATAFNTEPGDPTAHESAKFRWAQSRAEVSAVVADCCRLLDRDLECGRRCIRRALTGVGGLRESGAPMALHRRGRGHRVVVWFWEAAFPGAR